MVHQQCAELNSFFPLTLPRFSCEGVFTKWPSRALAGAGWVQDTKISCFCPTQAVTPSGTGVPAGLRSQLPPHPAAELREVSLPKPRACFGCCNELRVGLANLVLCMYEKDSVFLHVLCRNVQKYRGQSLRRTPLGHLSAVHT